MATPKGPFEKVESCPGFDKDLKRLTKKFPTLPEDLNTFINTALKGQHKFRQEIHGIVQIAGLGIESAKVYKAVKFACRSLKGKGAASGVRVIYAYREDKDDILLIEIYYKADQANEDKERIIKAIREW